MKTNEQIANDLAESLRRIRNMSDTDLSVFLVSQEMKLWHEGYEEGYADGRREGGP